MNIQIDWLHIILGSGFVMMLVLYFFFRLVRVRVDPKMGFNAKGIRDIMLTEGTSMRVFQEKHWFEAHDGVEDACILQRGEFSIDGLQWFRYTSMESASQYEKRFKKYLASGHCMCDDCNRLREHHKIEVEEDAKEDT